MLEHPKPLLLIFPFNLLSHYLRCLMLAKHFSSYFDILFAYSKPYSGFVEDEGFQTFECHSLDAQKVMGSVKEFDFSWLNEKDLDNVLNDQVRVIKQLKPLLVLGDTSPTLKMAAEKTGVQFVSLMNGYMSKYYVFARKLSRTHPLYPLLNIFPVIMLEVLTKRGEAIAMRKVHLPFKKLRKRNGLLQKNSYLDELEGDINLICDLNELFPQKGLPGNYKLIPPLYYNVAAQPTGLLHKLDKTKRTIFVSMGSTGDWKDVTFLNNPYFAKYNLVIAGDDQNALHAHHAIRAGFVNFHEIFPETDLVICHGGNGTIYQSLFYGIPVLCKTSHFEQEWNVAALERIGAGKSLDDLKSVSDHITLIEQWINKKNGSSLRHYGELILRENTKLYDTVKQVAEHVIDGPIV